MSWLESLFNVYWLGNPPARWAIATLIALGVAIGLAVIKRVLAIRARKLAERTANRWDDVVVGVLQSTGAPIFIAAGIAAGARSLDLSHEADLWIGRGLVVTFALQSGFWITRAVRLSLERRPVETGVAPEDRTFVAALGFAINLMAWSMLTLLVLSNFGVEVSTLIAGLGIGGIAAALAVQNVLGDVFAAVSIYLDRPFDIGDFVIVESYMGTVERISWRSTQLRSLGGELVVLANSDLASARLRNYRRMSERRVVVKLGVEYGTPADGLERIPAILAEQVRAIETLRFDRAHFSGYGASSLDFELVFYVLSPDYNVFMDCQQALLLAIYRRFEQEGFAFAFPTQTVHVFGQPQAA